MREHEIQMTLNWIGLSKDKLITEDMLRTAIKYAYNIGYSDGSYVDASVVITPLAVNQVSRV